MTERERMLSGKLYNPYKVTDNLWEEIRVACAGSDMVLTPPFYCDDGFRMERVIRIAETLGVSLGSLADTQWGLWIPYLSYISSIWNENACDEGVKGQSVFPVLNI